jgi:hypothetical protein
VAKFLIKTTLSSQKSWVVSYETLMTINGSPTAAEQMVTSWHVRSGLRCQYMVRIGYMESNRKEEC